MAPRPRASEGEMGTQVLTKAGGKVARVNRWKAFSAGVRIRDNARNITAGRTMYVSRTASALASGTKPANRRGIQIQAVAVPAATDSSSITSTKFVTTLNVSEIWAGVCLTSRDSNTGTNTVDSVPVIKIT